ncbi:unnamed protein product, partial [Vitis vinifera]|uniref:Uncharacterized protein n=1 Tax=Vitis vinifera TaxID=29760 RepID=D7T3D0_VITVI
MFLAKAKLATTTVNLWDRLLKSFPYTDLVSADCKHSIQAVPVASETFHLLTRSMLVCVPSLRRCCHSYSTETPPRTNLCIASKTANSSQGGNFVLCCSIYTNVRLSNRL